MMTSSINDHENRNRPNQINIPVPILVIVFRDLSDFYKSRNPKDGFESLRKRMEKLRYNHSSKHSSYKENLKEGE